MSSTKSLRVLIVGLNYAPERVGIAVYSSGLAEALVERGHQVSVIAGKPYYPCWRVDEGFRGGWRLRDAEKGVDVTRVAHYVPVRPNGARRIAHHASFALSSLFPALRRVWELRPDIVVTVAPSLIAAPVARLAAALCGAKSWLHLQDFEVEAAVATGLAPGGAIGARLGQAFERAVLGMFDRVSTISPAMCRKLRDKGVEPERVVEFRNWASLERIGAPSGESAFRDEWRISTPHVALYSGNIANKQGIELVVAAARRLRERGDLTFVVCGEGPNRARLEAQAADLGNIRFHDLQPKERLADLLDLATVHLLPQLAAAADLVLPSKLTNMLASGRAVVATAHPGTGLCAEVEGCGLVTPPGDDEAFAGAIERLLDDSAAREAFGQAAGRRARLRWGRDAIIDGFEREIARLTHDPQAIGDRAAA